MVVCGASLFWFEHDVRTAKTSKATTRIAKSIAFGISLKSRRSAATNAVLHVRISLIALPFLFVDPVGNKPATSIA